MEQSINKKVPYDIKQVIVVRKDLKMNKGKIAAQVAHASMAFLTKRLEPKTFHGYNLELKNIEEEWLDGSFAKIVLWADNAEELHKLHEQALEAGIEAHFIIDSGHTCFNGVPTLTCLGIGPDTAENIDPITKHLKLAR